MNCANYQKDRSKHFTSGGTKGWSKKKKQFEKGQKQLNTKFYHDRKTDLDRKLKDFFDKNNNSNKPKVP